MTAYKRIDKKENEKHSKWYLSINTSGADDQFNQNPYEDLLNKEAVDEFFKETHEKYYERFSENFGKCVRNVFTDEPRWHRISEVKLSEEGSFGVLPWTMGFEEYFKKRLNADIFDFIPELFLNFKDEYSEMRYIFTDR